MAGVPEARAGDPAEAPPNLSRPPWNWTWAGLMRRAFALGVLASARCGGRLRLIAMVEDPVAVRQILAVGRPSDMLGSGLPLRAGRGNRSPGAAAAALGVQALSFRQRPPFPSASGYPVRFAPRP